MKVRILVAAKYAEFRSGRFGAEWLDKGVEIDWPPHYAEDCIASGLVEIVVKAEAEPGPEAGPVELNITAAAFKLAVELEVAPGALVGTGQGGRIIVADVRRAAP